MVVALAVLVIARTTPLGGTAASPSQVLPTATSSMAAAVSVAPSGQASASPSPTAAATPSASASARPTPTPRASPRTYKVRPGDTIASIAAKLHSSVKAIVTANKIVDPHTIRPGQILIIP
jgi:LysM repeat protein